MVLTPSFRMPLKICLEKILYTEQKFLDLCIHLDRIYSYNLIKLKNCIKATKMKAKPKIIATNLNLLFSITMPSVIRNCEVNNKIMAETPNQSSISEMDRGNHISYSSISFEKEDNCL